MKTPYDVLGVAPDADEKTIASAFREAAKACHPDLNPEGRASEQQFKQVVAARDALKDPERRALYRYLQLSRQHERRHWLITIASCTLSALVSAGLVGLLQKPSSSEPLLEDRALLDPGVEIGSRQFGFALAGTSADPSRSGDNDPLQIAAFREPSAAPAKGQDETDAQRQNLATLEVAPTPAPLTPPALAQEKAPTGDSSRATAKGTANAPQVRPAPNKARTATAPASSRGPGQALLSLLGRATRSRPLAPRSKHASSQASRTAQHPSPPSSAGPNECWANEGGTITRFCGTHGSP
jgi:curved DNA-binding protein CbpA